MTPKRICHFGIFDRDYIRNKVIALGFEAHGYEVVSVTVDPSIGSIKKFIELFRKYRALRDKNFKYVIVGYPGHTVVWLARFLFGKKIIFDAFLSLYDANVLDRRLYSLWSPRGIRDWLHDWSSCKLAHKVLLPEKVHVEFFSRTFGVAKEKCIQIYTGANDEIFRPLPNIQEREVFTVHFHGNFIPLQGVEYIVDAAYILKDHDITFQLIGSGGELFENIQGKVRDLGLKNIDMLGRKPLKEVVEWINRAHVCLGVFGSTEKTKRVISNKIYECIATNKPLITSRTPATEELFTDREHVLFTNVADGKDIAEKIIILKNDSALRERIAKGGHELFTHNLTPKRLVEKLLQEL